MWKYSTNPQALDFFKAHAIRGDAVDEFDLINAVASPENIQSSNAAEPRQVHVVQDSAPVIDPQQYSLFNTGPIFVGLVSAIILPKPTTLRIEVSLINTHLTQDIWINFGSVAAVGNGIPVYANGGFVSFSIRTPQDDIYAIGTGALTSAIMTYSNKS